MVLLWLYLVEPIKVGSLKFCFAVDFSVWFFTIPLEASVLSGFCGSDLMELVVTLSCWKVNYPVLVA